MKSKKIVLIDVHTTTVAYLEKKFKPTYQIIVNQFIGENNGIYPDRHMP